MNNAPIKTKPDITTDINLANGIFGKLIADGMQIASETIEVRAGSTGSVWVQLFQEHKEAPKMMLISSRGEGRSKNVWIPEENMSDFLECVSRIVDFSKKI